MKSFFKMVLAVIVGYLLLSLLSLLAMLPFILLVAASDSGPTVEPHSILRINLGQPIVERAYFSSPFSFSRLPSKASYDQIELLPALEAIDHAMVDDKITGIYLDCSDFALDFYSSEELLAKLQEFAQVPGKFIYAYAPSFSQFNYLLASTADSIFMNPAGDFSWSGLSTTVLYMKDLFDKLGIEPQVVRHGKYKSAVEPCISNRMSEANREQILSYLNGLFGFFTQTVAEARHIPVDSLNAFANNVYLAGADRALKAGFIDAEAYIDQLDSLLIAKSGQRDTTTPNFVDFEDYVEYASRHRAKNRPNAPRVAVLYAQGNIVQTDGTEREIGSQGFIDLINELRTDDDIHAVVLRICSGGGSALASEEIWRALELLKAEKPLVVSMGSMAASGGYYIASGADRIFADRTTLTGSIGVFGLFFTAESLFADKLGLTPQPVRTHQHADLGSLFRGMSDQENKALQDMVERVYGTFTTRVADGRNLRLTYVDSIGQGRVWTGEQARANGLVDSIAGLQSAIKTAAELAALDSYRVNAYPKAKDQFLKKYLKAFMGGFGSASQNAQLPLVDEQVELLRQVEQMRGIQARLPFQLYPPRANAQRVW